MTEREMERVYEIRRQTGLSEHEYEKRLARLREDLRRAAGSDTLTYQSIYPSGRMHVAVGPGDARVLLATLDITECERESDAILQSMAEEDSMLDRALCAAMASCFNGLHDALNRVRVFAGTVESYQRAALKALNPDNQNGAGDQGWDDNL